jgi:hypothetical protein
VKVTQWFRPDVEPINKGVYQICVGGELLLWAKWQNKEWKTFDRYFDRATCATSRSFLCYVGAMTGWRGIAKE